MAEYFVKDLDGPITEDELDDMICTSNMTWLSIHLVLCLVGTANCGLNATVLTRKKMLTGSLNVLLAGLQVCNVVFLATYLPSLIFRMACPVYLFQTWVVLLFAVLSNTPRALVIFTNCMTCCVAGWRFFAVTWPTWSRACLTRRAAVILIPGIGAWSTALSFYLFFGLHTDKVDIQILDPKTNSTSNITVYNRTTDSLGSLHTYDFNKPAFISIHVLGYLIPSILAVGFNAGLIANVFISMIKRRRLVEGQHRATGSRALSSETKMTILLVVLLLANVFCYVTPGLFILAKALCVKDCGPSMPGHWHDLFDDYRAVLVLNCFEIIGYYHMSGNYRETFKELLGTAKKRLHNIVHLRVSI